VTRKKFFVISFSKYASEFQPRSDCATENEEGINNQDNWPVWLCIMSYRTVECYFNFRRIYSRRKYNYGAVNQSIL